MTRLIHFLFVELTFCSEMHNITAPDILAYYVRCSDVLEKVTFARVAINQTSASVKMFPHIFQM